MRPRSGAQLAHDPADSQHDASWLLGATVMLNRRSFLANASGLAATLAFRHGLFAQLETAPSSLPDQKLYEKNEDVYWSELRKQFLIPEDEVYLNNGTVGSSPAPVTDRKSTRLNSSHVRISYAVFCLKKKKKQSSINRSQ